MVLLSLEFLLLQISQCRHSAALLHWNSGELTKLNCMTTKLMTMHNAPHTRSNIDCHNIPRKEEDRGLQSTKETLNLAFLELENYVKKFTEYLLLAARAMNSDLIKLCQ